MRPEGCGGKEPLAWMAIFLLFKALRAVCQALKKRSSRSQRSEDKQDKEVEEDIGPTMAQNGFNMVPKWFPKWPQVGPKMVPRCPKKATKNNKNMKTKKVAPQEAPPRK